MKKFLENEDKEFDSWALRAIEEWKNTVKNKLRNYIIIYISIFKGERY